MNHNDSDSLHAVLAAAGLVCACLVMALVAPQASVSAGTVQGRQPVSAIGMATSPAERVIAPGVRADARG